jgi:hypothetical protein
MGDRQPRQDDDPDAGHPAVVRANEWIMSLAHLRVNPVLYYLPV